jgi:hypothetical protein
MVNDLFGLKKPLELTQGHYLGALVAFFVLLWKVDKQSEKIKQLQTAIKNVEEVAKYIGSRIPE